MNIIWKYTQEMKPCFYMNEKLQHDHTCFNERKNLVGFKKRLKINNMQIRNIRNRRKSKFYQNSFDFLIP